MTAGAQARRLSVAVVGLGGVGGGAAGSLAAAGRHDIVWPARANRSGGLRWSGRKARSKHRFAC
jgi:ketopantoate reductase